MISPSAVQMAHEENPSAVHGLYRAFSERPEDTRIGMWASVHELRDPLERFHFTVMVVSMLNSFMRIDLKGPAYAKWENGIPHLVATSDWEMEGLDA